MNKKLVALLTAASMILGSSTIAFANEGEPITDLVTYVTDGSLVTPNIFLNQGNTTSLQTAANYYEGLMEMDNHGNLLNSGSCESYTEDNGLTWTFKIREGVKWVNYKGEAMADYTAYDYITGLEYVMNYWKNDSVNTTIPRNIITGAEDYFQLTKAMAEEEAMALDTTQFLEMVGIEAPDAYTLIYHCNYNVTYFESATASAAFYPVSQALIDTLDSVDELVGLEYTELWYSGPYIVSDFLAGNSLVLSKNPLYWDTEASLFDTVTYLVVSDNTLAYTLYENGEIDRVQLDTATLKSIHEDESHRYHDELTQTRTTQLAFSLYFNYFKINGDGTADENWNTAVANEAFRKALYYGIDWVDYLACYNFIDPLSMDLDTYTVPGLISFTDGTDYTARVKELLGREEKTDGTLDKYNLDLAHEYKAQAIEELTAQGVTFPVEMVWHIQASSQDMADRGTVLKQIVEEFDSEFVTLELDTYVTSWGTEVINPQLQCISIIGMDAFVADVHDFLSYMRTNADSSMIKGYSNADEAEDAELIALFEEFNRMEEDANDIVDDMDTRLEAFAQAEYFLVDHALTIPLFTKNTWELSHINDYSRPYARYGVLAGRWKNIESSTEAYSTEDYQAFKAAWEAGE